jgi:excisionase family DNA binding protein
MSEWLTVTEAADYLKVHRDTIYAYCEAAKLPWFDMPAGKGRRFRPQDLDAVLRPSGSLAAMVELGLERAAALGHEMANEGSSDKPGSETAFYRCRNCRQVFTVGYESGVDGPRGTMLRFIAATAHTNRCSG